MKHFFLHAAVVMTVAISCCTTAALSQTKEDRAVLDKARSAYLTQPVPGSISCNVTLDWDRFFQDMKIPVDDTVKARIAKLMTSQISVVSRGQGKTDVKIDLPDEFASMKDGLRQQLTGFFDIYWAESYGRSITPAPGETFVLTRTPDGYNVKTETGGAKVELDLDKAYLMTHESVLSPEMNATMTPVFKPGDDGLLRLRSLSETVEMGATKMVVDFELDYQKVGAFEAPQHVRMSLPGSFAFNYTFSGCNVTGSGDQPAAAK